MNAKALEQKQAAILIRDEDSKERLVATAISLAKDKKLQAEMSGNLAALSVSNADEVIAREILHNLQ